MSAWLAAFGVGVAFAFIQYGWRRTHRGPAPIVAAALRVLSVALLVALLLDAPATPARALSPWVALDASLSMARGDSALWREALDTLRSIQADTVLLFGDSARPAPRHAAPSDVMSQLRPAIDRATASGHSLIVITDGEIDDRESIASLAAGSRIIVLARRPAPDVALLSIDAPRAIVSGDTTSITVNVAVGGSAVAGASVELFLDGHALATTRLGTLPPFSGKAIEFRAPIAGPPGPAVLMAVAFAAGDVESRNDTVVASIDRSDAASAVLVSTSPDPDARYAIEVLRGALAIPTRAFFRVTPEAWRIDGALTPVSEQDVRKALRVAPVAVIHGDTSVFGPPRSAAIGSLALLVPARDTTGEWYATGSSDSPIAGTLAGVPWDSLAPISVSGAEPHGDWRAVLVRRGREGDPRAILVGSDTPRRVVTVTASGLWRWRVRGGASAEAFTVIWGSVFDWLAAERQDRRAAIPDAAWFRAGQLIRWRRGSAADTVVPVTLRRRNGPSGNDLMTLHFGPGVNVVTSPPLQAGLYDVTTRGGSSIVAVNAAAELMPRAATITSEVVRGSGSFGQGRRARDLGVLYVVVVLLLCGEWLVRRQIGMR